MNDRVPFKACFSSWLLRFEFALTVVEEDDDLVSFVVGLFWIMGR
jgi:hypothetical protein